MAKNILAPLGITAAASSIDARFFFLKKKKRKHGPGTTTLIISNKEINDIMKIVQAIKDFYWKIILLEVVTKTIRNETKEQKGRLVL